MDTEAKKEYVVLLHGLARSGFSMSSLAKRLERASFRVVNQSYPSRSRTIESLAASTIPAALAQCKEASTVHFVTHSMGGILVRQYLSQNPVERLGRVVMLGPPNQGSEVVDKLGKLPGFAAMNGPAGLQLGTGGLSLPRRLGPANFEVGVIAGNRSLNFLLSALLPNEDDGKVSVASTRLANAADHITLPVTHTFMMRNRKVIAQVIHFLRHGHFQRNG